MKRREATIAFTILALFADAITDATLDLHTAIPLVAGLVFYLVTGLDLVPLGITISIILSLIVLDGVDLVVYAVMIITYSLIPHLYTRWRGLFIFKTRQLLLVTAVVASPAPLATYYNVAVNGVGVESYPTYVLLVGATTAIYLFMAQILDPDPMRIAIIGNKLALNPEDIHRVLTTLAKVLLVAAIAVNLYTQPLLLLVALAATTITHFLLSNRGLLENTVLILIAVLVLVVALME